MRIRHHVNPLRSDFLVPRGLFLAVEPGRAVEVELGCADAQFLFERAAQDPARQEIGLEIRADLVDQVNLQARSSGARVEAHFANANVELPHLFAPGSIARFFVNFPDPWFKQRHRKRRVVDDALVLACAVALAPGGELFFQSAVFDLALDALAVFEDHPADLANQAGPWSFWKRGNPYGVRSRRERWCEETGTPVWRMLYRRVTAPRAR
jgi:tRNA (guanine-N7-)-methyltransferase